MNKKPIIKKSENGLWFRACCPVCGEKLYIQDDRNVLGCREDDYEIKAIDVDWDNL